MMFFTLFLFLKHFLKKDYFWSTKQRVLMSIFYYVLFFMLDTLDTHLTGAGAQQTGTLDVPQEMASLPILPLECPKILFWLVGKTLSPKWPGLWFPDQGPPANQTVGGSTGQPSCE